MSRTWFPARSDLRWWGGAAAQNTRTAGPPPAAGRPQSPPAPPGALVEGAAVYRVAAKPRPGRPRVQRPAPPVVAALRRLPNPRLTGLGAGLFASAVMLVIGFLDWLLFGGSPAVYGLLFLPVSALTAAWVRTADLVTAPIGVPIAFAVGVVPVSGGTGGIGGQAMALVTALAVHAGWLYGGTLVAGLVASVRKVRAMNRRQRGPAGPGGQPPVRPVRRPAPERS
ncbi:integral membrane protein [Streptomyces laurentii]|uniref:Integral membrane protein n=1 Tax=Streptomyces laurentii TaxID=39478 RepID=A0A160P403_STRLU|nr:integral membrane protein [Streptomyces laurentii]